MPGQPGLPNLTAMRGRRKGGAPAPQSTAPQGMAAHAEAFLENLAARHYSAASIDAHRWALRQFTAWAASRGTPDPVSYQRADLEAYQLFLHRYRSPRGGRALAINTQLARLGCLRRFFARLCRAGTIPANPAADLDLPRKQARQLPKALSVQEIQLLLAIPDPTDPFGLRDRALLELFYATGIRRTEMTRLDLGDYDPFTYTLHIRKGKGGKSRMLPVGERCAAWLTQHLENSRPHFAHLPGETALFLSGYGSRITPAYLGNWIKKLMKRCGIEKPGSCHLFRHSCATDMHRGGADIRYVQEMLGHARLETTQIYTHVHIEALREVHTRSHPHGRLEKQEDGNENHEPEKIPSLVPAEPLIAESMLATVAHTQSDSRHPAESERQAAPTQPPERDDPPDFTGTSRAPRTPRNPAPAGGSRQLTPSKNRRESPENKDFSGRVSCYAYRWYNTYTGGWQSRDPIGERGGMNLYGFVGNDGIGRIDKFGLAPKEEEVAVVQEAIIKIFDQGQKELVEYGGLVCCHNETGKYRVTMKKGEPLKIDEALSFGMFGAVVLMRENENGDLVFHDDIACDEDETVVADWHIHPFYDLGHPRRIKVPFEEYEEIGEGFHEHIKMIKGADGLEDLPGASEEFSNGDNSGRPMYLGTAGGKLLYRESHGSDTSILNANLGYDYRPGGANYVRPKDYKSPEEWEKIDPHEW